MLLFLLVTTAWLAGDTQPPARPVAPGPVYAAPAGSACCGDTGYNDGCGGGGHRFGGWFHRGGDCGCETHHADNCGGCGGHRLGGLFHRGGDCGCETQHADNCCGGGHRWFSGGWFHRGGDCGCDNGCGNGYNGYNGYNGHYGPAQGPQPEPLKTPPKEAPRKMPEATSAQNIAPEKTVPSPRLVIEQ